MDPRRNRLILSEKAATQELCRQRKARAADELNVGIVDGLVRRSETAWDKGVNPMTVHRVGDPVRVVVTAIDPAKERISISIKRLADDPWAG